MSINNKHFLSGCQAEARRSVGYREGGAFEMTDRREPTRPTDLPPNPIAPPRAQTIDRPPRPRLQFSIGTLLLGMLAVSLFCAALGWLGTVWVVPITLATLSITSLVLAVRQRTDLRMLKLGYWHFALWLALAAAASALAVNGCLSYNEIAGTDKTREHIVQISAAVLAGPMVGPVANEGAGTAAAAVAWKITAILLVILFSAASPFLLVRRRVHWSVALFCWIIFIAASILWFTSAMAFLANFLS